MSFDLLAFPPSGPRTVSEVRQLLDAEEQRLVTGTDDPLPPLGPEIALLVDEIRQRWPSLEDDPGSPWSVSPDWQPMMGGGTEFAIVWSRADEMYTAIVEIAARANVIIYDRQVPEGILPSGADLNRQRRAGYTGCSLGCSSSRCSAVRRGPAEDVGPG